jgi:DNA polymerase I
MAGLLHRLPLAPTRRLYNGVYCPIDSPSPMNVRRLDLGCLELIQMMHESGMEIDLAHFENLRVRVEGDMSVVMDKIRAEIGGKELNPKSTQQVGYLLYKQLGLAPQGGKVRLTGSGKLSTDDESLSLVRNQHPVVPLILDYRELATLMSNFILPLPLSVSEDGRVRTVFKYTTAATGRLASGDRDTGARNFQNLPVRGDYGKQIRYGFRASTRTKRDGKPVKCVLVSNDLSQIEMVWTAEVSGDPAMRSVFLNGEDMHDRTACSLFKLDYATQDKKDPVYRATMRLPAKTMGFLVVYGGGALNLQSQIAGGGGPWWELDQCEDFIQQWFGEYWGVRLWMDEQERRGARYGGVWDYFGRFRPVPQCQSAIPRMRAEGGRQAGNMPVQGSAQGTIKLAMAEVTQLVHYYRDLGKVCNPLLQVHDELITEVEEDIADEFRELVQAIMVGAVVLSIPVNASSDVSDTWGGLK